MIALMAWVVSHALWLYAGSVLFSVAMMFLRAHRDITHNGVDLTLWDLAGMALLISIPMVNVVAGMIVFVEFFERVSKKTVVFKGNGQRRRW